MDAFRTAYIYIRNVFAGKLCETDEGYSFSYNKQYLNRETASSVSLTLPLSEEIYTSKTLKSKPRLMSVDYPAGYILKPQVMEFEVLPEAEHFVMCMTSTIPHALIKGNRSLVYITKRSDRVFEKDSIQMPTMEDFCKLDLLLTQDKYRDSYERCAKITDRYSSRSGLDMTELYLRLAFSFIVDNFNMHLKTFRLLEQMKVADNIYSRQHTTCFRSMLLCPKVKNNLLLQ